MTTKVSVVIVCMNNLKNLYPCLESIHKYTNVSYEVLVTAYLFSKENLEKVRSDFPWVTFIESNEIRGFSENNNLALKHAKGEYCFVLNDDTEMYEPVIDKLVASIERTPNAAVMSPNTYYKDGRLQSSGRPRHTMWTYILRSLYLWDERKIKSPYTHQEGIFKTYTLLGAAFLIKTDVFRNAGWFDERFFFCPEDIALGQLLTESGYGCYVDADTHLVHIEGGTWSIVNTATSPAARRGSLIYLSHGSSLRYLFMGSVAWTISFLKWAITSVRSLADSSNETLKIRSQARWNELHATFTRETPKEIFIKYYCRLKK